MVCDTARINYTQKYRQFNQSLKMSVHTQTSRFDLFVAQQPQRQCKHVSSFTVDINDEEFFALIHI